MSAGRSSPTFRINLIFNLQSRTVQHFRCLTLKMKVLTLYETSVTLPIGTAPSHTADNIDMCKIISGNDMYCDYTLKLGTRASAGG